MTQATDTDIREIKDLIAALDKKIDVGFADIKGEFKEVRSEIKEASNRLTTVETSIKGLDARLWGFGGIILGAVLAALLTIFGRFLFTGTPIS